MPAWDTRANEIFLAALDIEDLSERRSHIETACGDDAELRQQVEALLEAHGKAGSFLDRPAEPVATADFVPMEDAQTIPPLIESPGTQIGPYKLLELIGEGGMGSVWLAEQREPVRRRVALKVVKAGMNSNQIIARFEAERQALALMDHPNIAKILDGGVADSRPYFVMELVKGTPITTYCDQHRLTPAERLQLFVQVCQAVQHAHQKGIIHRDLKPSNVLVAPFDGRPVVKVIDFGVAKAIGQQLTERTMFTGFGAMIGTLQYMSPEQAELNNQDIDTRSDIYSLGVVLYELLTGSTPLDMTRLRGAAMAAMLMAVHDEEPPKPSTRLSESNDSLPSIAAQRHMEPAKLTKLVRGDLDWIVMKALSKDRTRRYETANGLAADLLRYLGGEPVTAHPPSAAYRMRKFVRQNRAAVVATSLVSFALVLGTGIAAWQAIRANHARREEANQRSAAEKARDSADEEKLIAQTVRNFLQHKLLLQTDTKAQADALLKAGRSSEEAERDPRISVLLARAAAELTPEKIGKNFPNQPAVQADLLETVGSAYRGLGDYPRAIAFLERSRDLRTAQFGADDPSTLNTVHNLAVAFREAGKLAEAIRLFEQVRTGRELRLGPTHRDTLNTLNSLAVAYEATGRLTEAIEVLEKVLQARITQLGPEDGQTLNTLNNLAFAYDRAGQLQKAIRLYEQARDALTTTLGPTHPNTLVTVDNLANVYSRTGKLKEAILLQEQARAIMIDKLGPNHPTTIISTNNLAGNYWAAGRTADSVALFEQAATAIEKLRFQHQYAEKIVTSYIRTLDETQNLDQATAWRRKWLPIVKERYGPESTQFANQLAGISGYLIQREQWAEAQSILQECIAIRDTKEPNAWTTFNVRSQLGWTYMNQGKLTEAEPLLVSGYEGMKQRESRISEAGKIRMTDALERLIKLYEAWDKPDEAAKWRKELDALKAAKP